MARRGQTRGRRHHGAMPAFVLAALPFLKALAPMTLPIVGELLGGILGGGSKKAEAPAANQQNLLTTALLLNQLKGRGRNGGMRGRKRMMRREIRRMMRRRRGGWRRGRRNGGRRRAAFARRVRPVNYNTSFTAPAMSEMTRQLVYRGRQGTFNRRPTIYSNLMPPSAHRLFGGGKKRRKGKKKRKGKRGGKK